MSHTEQLMTERYPDMRGSTSPILDRINEAARRVSGGAGLMRIPVEATDVDIVLADCGATIKNLASERDELVKALRSIHGYLGEYGMPTVCEETVSEMAEVILAKYPESKS